MLLLAHSSADAVIAYRGGAPLTVHQFLHDVARVREVLGASRQVLNVCSDRYHFAVGFAAALTAGQVTLLPSSHTPEFIRQLRGFAPDAVCLTDRADCDLGLPQVAYPRSGTPGEAGTPPNPR